MSSIQHVINKLKAHRPPERFVQKPFEHDGKAYNRLCKLDGSQPSGEDLLNYAEDLKYSSSGIQKDLFKYLLPICLSAWSDVLLGQAPRDYVQFAEQFFPALIKQRVLYELLNGDEFDTVQLFVTETILERINKETSLSHSGGKDEVYRWFEALSAFAIVFPNLEKLWKVWWCISTPGHAVGALQYISCLMYENDSNPIFDPWTPAKGGGAPLLSETGCNFSEERWLAENVNFIRTALNIESVERALKSSTDRLNPLPEHASICKQMLDDWSRQVYLLEWRINQLPQLLTNLRSKEWPLG